jgi:deazaflavin-dependent oxidoreductase (nitroreductase family)
MTTAPLPASAPPPARGRPAPSESSSAPAKAMFKLLNRWFMVPAVHAGLGAWISCPAGGYIILLRVRGRRSGLVRETPLNYVIEDGAAWVLAGFGAGSAWYQNVLADPDVEIVLPGRRPMAAVASDVSSTPIRTRVIPAILRSTIGPSLMSGVNPFTATDEALAGDMSWVPLVRLTPVDEVVEPGPDDPGGRAWIWRQALVLAATITAWRLLLRLGRGVTNRGR